MDNSTLFQPTQKVKQKPFNVLTNFVCGDIGSSINNEVSRLSQTSNTKAQNPRSDPSTDSFGYVMV